MSIVSGDDGADYNGILFSDKEKIILRRYFVVDDGARLIVGTIIGEGLLPERCDLGGILIIEYTYEHELIWFM
jgi:hypothetical protein|tara:strand:- start:511 stop:729 length:219 start_codon:yes stop_codon:yes gene_type:complete